MPERFELEQLVIDDSFISYCFRKNEADVAFWEQYLRQYPAEAATVEEAKELVLGISLMLTAPEEETPVINIRRGNPLKIWVAAAALLIVGAAAFFLLRPRAAQEVAQSGPQVYTTAMAEKKTLYLADSSRVILNAGSELTVDGGFGHTNRIVALKGEALFEVEHNAAQPFEVEVDGYKVRVLGTVFNVKAYPGEKKSETSLISGKVGIYLPDTKVCKTLQPKEKFVISKNLEPVVTGKPKVAEKAPAASIVPLSYNRQQVNVETAWSQNRLVFEDETFVDMREKLERWFDVNLVFEDEIIEQYRFTATFEKENIVQVMKALQASYPFTCSLKGKTVHISHQRSSR